MKVKILCLILCFALSFGMIAALASCVENHDCAKDGHEYGDDGKCVYCGQAKPDDNPPDVKPKTIVGTYVLESATLNGDSQNDMFSEFVMEFTEKNLRVYVNFDGIVMSRNNSTYVINDDVITETSVMGDVYEHRIAGEKITTVFEDGDDKYQVTLAKKKDEAVETQPVDFESVLFGEDINDTRKFNYCPAILTETDKSGKEIMNIWYCTNKQTGIIMDHIGYRTGVKQSDGKWLFSDEQIVLEPTVGTWDGRHTCDPAVIKGEFNFKGEKYSYLMSYLGCTTEDYQKNETGLAVAKNVGGPWVKVTTSAPIIPWYDNGDKEAEEQKYQSMQGTSSIYWGTGMPALISIDGKGEVLMFYASTKNGIGIRRYDFTDLDNPKLKFISSISHSGVLNSQSRRCNIGIPDFAFDPVTKRLYCASVTNERNPADVTPTRVNSHSMLLYLEGLNDMEAVSSALQNGGYTWKVQGYVGPSDTGWERNHNPGLVRDAFGYIPDSSKVGMVVSTGHNSWANDNIFTYRLFGQWFEIAK